MRPLTFITALSMAAAPSLGQVQATAPGALAWYGVSIQAPAREGLPAVVDDVFPDGPAERAGLAAGDTLLQLGALPAGTALARGALDRPRVGDTVAVMAARRGARLITVLRALPKPALSAGTPEAGVVVIHLDTVRHLMRDYLDAARRRVTVIAPSGFAVDRSDSGLVLTGGRRNVRLSIDSLLGRAANQKAGVVDTADNLRLLRARPESVAGMVVAEVPGPDSVSGVVVIRVESSSQLGRAGLRALDVIRRVNGNRIRSANDLARAASALPSRGSVIEIIRRGRRMTLEPGATPP